MNSALYPLNIHDPLVFTRLEDGKIDLFVSMSNECHISGKLNSALRAWVNDTDPVEIRQHFTISAPVDYIVQGYADVNGLIDLDTKPMVDAIRAEMLTELARIDALVFSSELKSSEWTKE